MKYVIVIPDGFADESQALLDGKTLLQAANTPSMDEIAAEGVVGLANYTPSHLPAGNCASLSLLGYDPLVDATGPAAFEAVAQGVELGDNDWCLRCDLVCVEDQQMKRDSECEISQVETDLLLETVREGCSDSRLEFVSGQSERSLIVLRPTDRQPSPFSLETRSTSPRDLIGKSVADAFPRGPGSDFLVDLMRQSEAWFDDHEVNRNRIANGKPAVTNIWLSSPGKKPDLESFQNIHGVRGGIITDTDSLKGLAAMIGWDQIDVPASDAGAEADYASKSHCAIEALSGHDLVCVHVSAGDAAAVDADGAKSVSLLEAIDQAIVGPILDHLKASGEEFRIMIATCDINSRLSKKHARADLPFAMCGSGIDADDAKFFSTQAALSGGLSMPDGWQLMPFFITRS